MKHVLIIDESALFRDYLKMKLEENEIQASIGINAMDGIAKMKNLNPDLIIMDAHLGRQGFMEVLRQKKIGPNTVNIPVIIMTQRMDQRQILEIAPYNVKKVFNKPIKIDALFAALTEILGVHFAIDESPGIVEVHVNDEIVFIEIAQGLNRDKMDLLGFKIMELIELYEIKLPKVIIMLSDITLGFADGPNLEKLFDVITKASRARQKYIRVLTRDDFTRQFIEGKNEYSDIEVVSNLQYAIDGLLTDINPKSGSGELKADLITDKILSADNTEENEALDLKFHTESDRVFMDNMKESLKNMRIAAVDDDFIIQELIKNTFRETGAAVLTYSNGEEFLAALDSEEFDLAFLDLMMPRSDGFEVLKVLQTRVIRFPIIVLSAITHKDTIIRAYQMGIKSFLVKPIKPKDIFKKSMEILKTNF
ncbi:MAG: response regulator [Treponema sp.]|nr:response regulator [Treponema sp.]